LDLNNWGIFLLIEVALNSMYEGLKKTKAILVYLKWLLLNILIAVF